MKPTTTLASAILAPLGLLLAGTATSSAGLLDTTVFTTADLNANGSLDKAEFSTTLEAGLNLRAQNRRFALADANANGSIQLNEFLIYSGTLSFGTKLERQFLLADASVDGTLSFDEFTASSGLRVSMVTVRRNFLRADVNENGSITLEEYLAYRRGQTPRVTLSIRQLADFDNNGTITELEFSYWYGRNTSSAKIAARFDKFDVNADGTLSLLEWHPGERIVL